MEKIILTSVMLLILCNLAFAKDDHSLLFEGGVNALIVSRNTFSIVVDDQVTGGCLPNPAKLKDKMEISLRKNGFGIAKGSGLFSNDIIITALGFKIGDSSCAVHIKAKLIFTSVIYVPFAGDDLKSNNVLVPFSYPIGSGLLTGGRYSMQNRLEKEVTEYADNLYLAISRAKDEIFPKFPSIKEKIIKKQSGPK